MVMSRASMDRYIDIPLETESQMASYTGKPLEYVQPLLPLYHQQPERQEPKYSRCTTRPCIIYITWLLLYIWCNYYQSQGLGDLRTMKCLLWPAYLYHAQFWCTLFIIMIQLTPHIAFALVGYVVAESLLQSPFIQALKEGLASRKYSQGPENGTCLGRLKLGLRLFLEVLSYGMVVFWGYALLFVWPIYMFVYEVCTIMSSLPQA